jgi:CspA family cold shock protein
MKGTVKMFNKAKGYGFIHTEDGKDVFFHFSALTMDDKVVEPGDNLEFDVEESPRGLRAENIKKI